MHPSPAAPPFAPGFRCSRSDLVVLATVTILAAALGRTHRELAMFVAAAVLHFFLFCNVFRIERRLELLWAAVFVAAATARLLAGAPWLLVAALVLGTTFAVLRQGLRAASYHGIFWQRLNPQLPSWWAEHRQRSERGA